MFLMTRVDHTIRLSNNPMILPALNICYLDYFSLYGFGDAMMMAYGVIN